MQLYWMLLNQAMSSRWIFDTFFQICLIQGALTLPEMHSASLAAEFAPQPAVDSSAHQRITEGQILRL